MKLLEINSVCGIRSTGRICTDIADTVIAAGDNCRIAYGRLSAPERYAPISKRFGSDRSVLFHMGNGILFGKGGYYSKAATQALISWAKEYDPDVIHLHNLHGFYLNVPMLLDYLRTSGKPIVWTLHDCWPFTGHCAYFDAAGCDRWKDGCHSCPQKRTYPYTLSDRSRKNWQEKKSWFCDLPNLHLVTPSQWLADRVGESFLKDTPVHVIPNGIDTGVFSPRREEADRLKKENNLDGKTVVLGVASIWEDRKGLPDFLRLRTLLDDSYHIVLIGLSKQQIKQLPQGILGITHTQNASELAAWYTAADLLVNPTYDDNFPTVNLEAQACGTPVVTYRTGGSPESVLPEHVVDKGDLQALCEAIKRTEKSEELSTDCIKRSLAFDKKCMVEGYCKLYRSLM